MGAVYRGRSVGSTLTSSSPCLGLGGEGREGAEGVGVLIKNPQSRFVLVVLSNKSHRDGPLLFLMRFLPAPAPTRSRAMKER